MRDKYRRSREDDDFEEDEDYIEEGPEEEMAFSSSREKASDFKDAVKKDVSKLRSKGKERYYETEEKAREYVEDNPMKALLVSAGIGAATGMIFALLLGKEKRC